MPIRELETDRRTGMGSIDEHGRKTDAIHELPIRSGELCHALDGNADCIRTAEPGRVHRVNAEVPGEPLGNGLYQPSIAGRSVDQDHGGPLPAGPQMHASSAAANDALTQYRT